MRTLSRGERKIREKMLAYHRFSLLRELNTFFWNNFWKIIKIQKTEKKVRYGILFCTHICARQHVRNHDASKTCSTYSLFFFFFLLLSKQDHLHIMYIYTRGALFFKKRTHATRPRAIFKRSCIL